MRFLHMWPEQLCLQNRTVSRQPPGEILTQYQESQDTYQETQKVEYTTLKSITEAASRLLLTQLSSTHQDGAPCHDDLPWHWLQEALPCWTEDFICRAAHPAPEILPCNMLITPVLTVLFPWPVDWESGTWVGYPLIVLCEVITDCFWVRLLLLG